MKDIWAISAMMVALAISQPAVAGSPLKGIDVKLGKNPGGGCSSRTTDAKGNADFGVWPKGNYYIIVSLPKNLPSLHVVVHGAAAGPLERDVDSRKAAGTAPLVLTMNGTTPLTVTVIADTGEVIPQPLDAAKIKSHSNQTNN